MFILSIHGLLYLSDIPSHVMHASA
uniref:Uncharacterized protein n=1 Tax=Arundo donax TaxID=35708 RepID=A0A0A9EQQ9_ARUDO